MEDHQRTGRRLVAREYLTLDRVDRWPAIAAARKQGSQGDKSEGDCETAKGAGQTLPKDHGEDFPLWGRMEDKEERTRVPRLCQPCSADQHG
jgi:hypothetical protein